MSARSVPAASKDINTTLLVVVMMASSMIAVTAMQMFGPLLLDLARDFKTTISVVGQLSSAGSLTWAIMGPISGTMADRWGRKPMMVGGALVFGAFTILSSWADSLLWLFVTRMLACTGGAFITANLMAGVADYFPGERRARVLGWVISGFSLAAMLCVPAVALVDQMSDWRWSLRMVGAALLTMGLVLHVTLPHVRPAGTQSIRATFSSLMGSRSVVGLLTSNIFERIFYGALATYLAAFLMQTYGLNAGQVAPVISAVAVATMLGTLAGGRITERFNPMMVYVVAQFIAGASSPALVLLPSSVLLSASLAAGFTGANALSRPAFMFMATQGGPSMRSAMLGLTVTANQVGLMLGAALGGLAIAVAGYSGFGLLCGVSGTLAAILCRILVRSEDLSHVGSVKTTPGHVID